MYKAGVMSPSNIDPSALRVMHACFAALIQRWMAIDISGYHRGWRRIVEYGVWRLDVFILYYMVLGLLVMYRIVLGALILY